MKRLLKVLITLLIVAFLGQAIIKKYIQYKREKEQKEYEESLVNTASKTVTVLRDSILIDYQNEKRTIHIYVPPDYDTDTMKYYPVMYFLDGESSFNDLENMAPEWEIDEVIDRFHQERKKTAIVIGISEADNRDAEYTPFINEDNPDAHGDHFANWLVTDLKKWVDENYRTQKEAEHTTIGGISRSGMMAYYMLMKHSDVIGNACIQSPSLWVDYDRLMDMNLPDSVVQQKKVFVSVGERESGGMVSYAEDLYNKFKAQGMNERQLKLVKIKDGKHWHMTWRQSFAEFYPWLMEK